MTEANGGGQLAGLSRTLGIGRLTAFSTDDCTVAHPTGAFSRLIAELRAVEPSTWRRIAEAVVMAAVTGLGFWGFQVKAGADVRWQLPTVWDSAFSTLQLLTTQFPRSFPPSEIPWQLQVARFFMPLFAAWFSIGALLRRFNRPVRAWTAGLSRDHVVLIGESNVATALARAYRKAGRRVVAITPTHKGDDISIMEQARARVVFGDARKESVLRRAAIQRAEVVIVTDDVGTDAVWLTMAVAKLCRKHRAASADRLILLVRLGHRDLRSLLRTQIGSAIRDGDSRVDLRLYVREQTLARSLLSRYPADWGLPPGPHDIHAAIIGLGYMGGELLLQLARIAVPAPGRRCVFTVVDRDADGLKDQLLAATPGLANCADELRFIQAEINPSAITADQVGEWLYAPVPATAIYVCCGDDGANLAMAIGLRKALALRRLPAPPMFVYQSGGSELIDGLADLHGATFDTLRIVPFGGVEEEADPSYLVAETVDALARAMHEQYLESRRQTASTGPSPAQMPWRALAETYRTANRSQADHARAKLRAIGWHAAIESGATKVPPAPSIEAAVLEDLAVQEHDRWCRDRWLAGWIHDSERNDAELRHPNLVPYDQLAEEVKSLDRDAVSGLPARLAELRIAVRRDLRLGIWFEGHDLAPSGQLVRKIIDLVAAAGGGGAERLHVQLVLPLRDPAELSIAADLGRRGDGGIDIAILRSPTVPGSATGARFSDDKSAIGRLIAVADRAFTLTFSRSPDSRGPATDTLAVAALCDVCDKVLLACEEYQAGEPILRQLEPRRRTQVEIVAVQH
ncbi:MAG: NAD-binding protein [Rhodospirillales bacterium]|nr:NAD-binding protein [Rhodospirillales bacterium]